MNTDRTTLTETITTGRWYELEVMITDTVTLKVGGVAKVSHTYAGGQGGGPDPGRAHPLRVDDV